MLYRLHLVPVPLFEKLYVPHFNPQSDVRRTNNSSVIVDSAVDNLYERKLLHTCDYIYKNFHFNEVEGFVCPCNPRMLSGEIAPERVPQGKLVSGEGPD